MRSWFFKFHKLIADFRNHPGRQSPIGAGKKCVLSKNIAPSAIPLSLGDNALAWVVGSIMFGTPQQMTPAQIDDVIARFARAASLASRAGFHGVEIHAGRKSTPNKS